MWSYTVIRLVVVFFCVGPINLELNTSRRIQYMMWCYDALLCVTTLLAASSLSFRSCVPNGGISFARTPLSWEWRATEFDVLIPKKRGYGPATCIFGVWDVFGDLPRIARDLQRSPGDLQRSPGDLYKSPISPSSTRIGNHPKLSARISFTPHTSTMIHNTQRRHVYGHRPGLQTQIPTKFDSDTPSTGQISMEASRCRLRSVFVFVFE